MREALKNTPAEQFTEPYGIQHILVDSVSGKLPTELTPATKSEVFTSFNLPKEFDDVHVAVQVNKLNGKLATSATPPEDLETRPFTVIHSEMPDNSNWEAPVQLWAAANGYQYPPTELDDGSISTFPSLGSPVITFITPAASQEITTMPITVQVNVTGATPTAVDLTLEGQDIGIKTSAPYSFMISQAKNGWQTLTAKIHLTDGTTAQNSIRINVTGLPQ
jgi:hypothetical protein